MVDPVRAERPRVEPEDVRAEIARIVRDELNLPHPVTLDSELQAGLALDSLSLLTLVVGLEDRFSVALHEEDAAEIRTVAQLAELVARRSREQP